ncbi:aldo/keto reductase [Streptomyces sp. DG1A-41]|uniref:aldo/keto reductase n=1 Tax=Streptomyces sp. DG1A-41 TaxID=3125779 RepID=UPI0030D3B4AB
MSLRHLGLERIDLCQLHRIDPQVPLADQLGAPAELRAAGRIRRPPRRRRQGVRRDAVLARAGLACAARRRCCRSPARPRWPTWRRTSARPASRSPTAPTRPSSAQPSDSYRCPRR